MPGGDLGKGLDEVGLRRHTVQFRRLGSSRSRRREELRAFLRERGVETGLHYPLPIHRQPCLATLEIDRSSYPVTDTYAIGCLSLTNFSGMTDAQAYRVDSTVRSFFGFQ
jgi:dTDP-4-amino-4,6-dideoxygalactose transaminase